MFISQPEGKLNKSAFKTYQQSRCQRKFWLSLGNHKAGWTDGEGPVSIEAHEPRLANTLLVYGNIYEELVFYWLNQNANVYDATPDYIDDQDWPEPEERRQIELAHWAKIIELTQQNQSLWIQEHQWIPEKKLAEHLIQDDASVMAQSRGDRPDLIYCRAVQNENVTVFKLEDGIPQKEELVRFTGILIHIWDVKNTDPIRCQHHFSDVLYYVYSLLYRLQDLNLGVDVRVAFEKHGIFARIPEADIPNIQAVDLHRRLLGGERGTAPLAVWNALVEVEWDLYHPDFLRTIDLLRDLYQRRTAFQSVEPSIGPRCAMCPFSHYCIDGGGQKTEAMQLPGPKLRLELMPGMNKPILNQINRLGEMIHQDIETVDDLVRQLPKLHQIIRNDIVPSPLHKNLPAISLQALSLSRQQPVWQDDATYQSWWAPGRFSFQIPKSTRIKLFVVAEIDPAMQRLFALGLRLEGLDCDRESADWISPSGQALFERAIINQGKTNRTEAACLAEGLSWIHTIREWVHVQGYGDIAMIYWGSTQWEALRKRIETLQEEPEIASLNAALQKCLQAVFPLPSTQFISPSEERHIYDLSRASQELVGLPVAFRLSWMRVYQALTKRTLNTREGLWEETQDFMDYSLWNLMVGDQCSLSQPTEYTRFHAVDDLMSETLVGAQGMFPSYTTGDFLNNPQVELILREETQKKLAAISGINAALLAQSAHFIVDDRWRLMNSQPHQYVSGHYENMPKILWTLYQREVLASFLGAQSAVCAPFQSIAGLRAAWVSISAPHNKSFFYATTDGVSLNVKLERGAWVALVDYDNQYISSVGMVIKNVSYQGQNLQFEVKFVRGVDKHWFGRQKVLMIASHSDNWSRRLSTIFDSSLGHGVAAQRLGQRLQLSNPIQVQAHAALDAAELYAYEPQALPTSSHASVVHNVLNPPMTADQSHAAQLALDNPISLIQGPPGTGKTTTIVALLEEWLIQSNGRSNILITASNYSAMNVLATKILEAKRADGTPTFLSRLPLVLKGFEGRKTLSIHQHKSKEGSVLWSNYKGQLYSDASFRRPMPKPDFAIYFANSYSLLKSPDHFPHFDGIVVDEASQLKPDHAFANYAFLKGLSAHIVDGTIQVDTAFDELTRVVIVGDDQQLAAVAKAEAPKIYENLCSSVFSYYREVHSVPMSQLEINFRSVKPIVDFIDSLDLYDTALQHHRQWSDMSPWAQDFHIPYINARSEIAFWVHDGDGDTVFSPVEAVMVAEMVSRAYAHYCVKHTPSRDHEIRFWTKEIGIVTPHNAQNTAIVRKLSAILPSAVGVSSTERDRLLSNAVQTVDRFQGAARTMMVGCIGVSSYDQLSAESSFLYQMNRFNVMVSRAEAIFVMICADIFLKFTPSEEESQRLSKVLRRLQKNLHLCQEGIPVQVGSAQYDTAIWRL